MNIILYLIFHALQLLDFVFVILYLTNQYELHVLEKTTELLFLSLLRLLDKIVTYIESRIAKAFLYSKEKRKSLFILNFGCVCIRNFGQSFIVCPGGFDEFYERLISNLPVYQTVSYAMLFEINRLQSFACNPGLNVYYIKLAKYGFFYDSNRKTCRCAFCGFEKGDWTEGNDVLEVHRRGNPSCPFLNNTSILENVPMHIQRELSASQAVAQHGYASSIQETSRGRKLCGRSNNQNQQNMLRQESDNNRQMSVQQSATSSNYVDQSIDIEADRTHNLELSIIDTDIVQCSCCDLRLAEWDPADDPWTEYARHSPTCAFLTHMTGNGFVHDIQKDWKRIYNPKHAAFGDRESRLNTFDGWRQDISPDLLSEAGFFFTGDNDIVRCFCCDLRLAEWDPADDPWTEHARHSPTCAFLKHMKGNGFVHDVKKDWERRRQEKEDSASRCNESRGENDIVRCFCCDFGLAEWDPKDDPWTEHARHSPTCGFLIHVRGNGFVHDIQKDWKRICNPKHAAFDDKESRINTFDGWREDISQTPDLLAEAGFFYTGEEDIVRCHYCDGGLRNWEPEDDPWEEHSRWFPFCKYVIKMKGREHIDEIKRQTMRRQEEEVSASRDNESREIKELTVEWAIPVIYDSDRKKNSPFSVENTKAEQPCEKDPQKLLETNKKLEEQLQCM